MKKKNFVGTLFCKQSPLEFPLFFLPRLNLFFSKCRPCRSSWEVGKHIRRHSYIVLTPIEVAQSLTLYPTWLDELLNENKKKFCWNTFLQTIAFRISFIFFTKICLILNLFFAKCRPCRSSWEVEKHIRRHSYIVLTPYWVAQSLTTYPTWLDELLNEKNKNFVGTLFCKQSPLEFPLFFLPRFV